MNFIESISNYILENITIEDLPNIGLIALSENISCDSIMILAGMNKIDNPFEIKEYFDNCINELKLQLPSKFEAAQILTKYYLNEIVKNPNQAYDIMITLDNEVYKKISNDDITKTFIGEELKIESLYTWYREIQDWNDNGIILFYKDLSRYEQRIKFEEHLVIEALNTLKHYYK